jgi:CBS domain-containing membrane protein
MRATAEACTVAEVNDSMPKAMMRPVPRMSMGGSLCGGILRRLAQPARTCRPCGSRVRGLASKPSTTGGSSARKEEDSDKMKERASEPSFMEKLRGVEGFSRPPPPATSQVLVTGGASFAGIGALSLLHFGVSGGSEWTLLLGSFGATAVLVFGAPDVPFSQPRNVVGGHLLAAAVGVCSAQLIALPLDSPWLAAPVAVSLATMAMATTRTVHPPAGGTALIAAMAAPSSAIGALGFGLLVPTGVGALVLVASATLTNNLVTGRRYPQSWT